jgi:V/A-type H+-transporting ATPase subunit I
VGYGLLLLIAGVVMPSKGPQKMKGIFVLITFLGAMTIVNGFFLNSFFGASIFSVKGVNGLAGSGGPLPFLGPKVIGGNSVFPAMTFSIYIGFIQMMLGMLMQITNRIRNKGLLFAVQPMCYIPMSLAVFIFLCKVDFLSMGSYEINGMQIGAMIAGVSDQVMKVLVLIGIVPFVFLNTPTLKIFLRPLMALYELYNFANDLVSSGLSYLRLFALGLAGGLLGNAFNEIALMLISNEQGEVSLTSPLIIFTVLIMVAGHALNFFLSALGAYVHSVRLMFVEFYKFVNFEGGGSTYVPFSENVTNNN